MDIGTCDQGPRDPGTPRTPRPRDRYTPRMLKLAPLTSLLLLMAATAPQAPPPATEVFVASFAIEDGKAVIGKPVNISNNPGYDNQPSFTPDGSAILFTSVRGDRKPDPANSAATGSDIYRYDVASRQISRVTSTPESEYSATVMPGGTHFSVVQVEADGTQRLWRFSLAGSGPELLLADIKPVGYHAWADEETLARSPIVAARALRERKGTDGREGHRPIAEQDSWRRHQLRAARGDKRSGDADGDEAHRGYRTKHAAREGHGWTAGPGSRMDA